MEVNLPFTCDECPDRFRTLHALAIHSGRDHGVKKYSCPREGCDVKHSNRALHLRHVSKCVKPENQWATDDQSHNAEEQKYQPASTETVTIESTQTLVASDQVTPTTTWVINPTEYVQTATGQEIVIQPTEVVYKTFN